MGLGYNWKGRFRENGVHMADWQTIAVGITVLAAAAWLLRGFVMPQKAAAGCGSGCQSCPAAAGGKPKSSGGFVGLEVLQSSITTKADTRDSAPAARS